MAKRVSIVFIAVLMLFQGTATLWIMSAFYLNREFIAQTQCENRFTANSSCQGQCVLMKKLQQEEESEQKRPDLKLKEVQLFVQRYEIPVFKNQDSAKTSGPCLQYIQPLYSAGYLAAIFHPPAVQAILSA